MGLMSTAGLGAVSLADEHPLGTDMPRTAARQCDRWMGMTGGWADRGGRPRGGPDTHPHGRETDGPPHGRQTNRHPRGGRTDTNSGTMGPSWERFGADGRQDRALIPTWVPFQLFSPRESPSQCQGLAPRLQTSLIARLRPPTGPFLPVLVGPWQLPRHLGPGLGHHLVTVGAHVTPFAGMPHPLGLPNGVHHMHRALCSGFRSMPMSVHQGNPWGLPCGMLLGSDYENDLL